MKILNREDFLKCPAGTIFSTYEPCVFHGLNIKGESIFYPDGGNDFTEAELIGALDVDSSDDYMEKCIRMENGEDMPTDFEFYGRNGMYEYSQKYAVYTKEDVSKLIELLKKTL